MMKKAFLPLFILLTVSTLVAQSSAEPIQGHPYLNRQADRVVYDVTEEAWVTTDTARVIVSINASMKGEGLSQLRSQIMQNLNEISQARWQITQFNQSQDSSGLDTVSASAEARIPEDQLTHVYSQAEELSQPGISFRIQYIDFSPSLKEINKTRTELREKIYEKANAEIQHLNQQFPDQVFKLHQLNFLPEISMVAMEKSDVIFNQMGRNLPSAINVSTNMKLSAIITLAAQGQSNTNG